MQSFGRSKAGICNWLNYVDLSPRSGVAAAGYRD